MSEELKAKYKCCGKEFDGNPHVICATSLLNRVEELEKENLRLYEEASKGLYMPTKEAELRFLRAENSALKSKLEKARKALKLGLKEAEETMRQVGGCDHSVNHCTCETQEAIRVIKEALTEIGEGK